LLVDLVVFVVFTENSEPIDAKELQTLVKKGYKYFRNVCVDEMDEGFYIVATKKPITQKKMDPGDKNA